MEEEVKEVDISKYIIGGYADIVAKRPAFIILSGNLPLELLEEFVETLNKRYGEFYAVDLSHLKDHNIIIVYRSSRIKPVI